jgi:ABC-type multidrug transport system fused ATPase/permease subunit
MDVKYLRSQMGYVSQEALLFEETVRWNLIVSSNYIGKRLMGKVWSGGPFEYHRCRYRTSM